MFKSDQYALSPLSDLLADIVAVLPAEEVIQGLSLLGNSQMGNYSENLITKLYENFSTVDVVDQLFSEDFSLFVRLAEVWPKFLVNKALIDKLTTITGEGLDVETKARVLAIQTHKNLLVPALINNHYHSFIQLSDKEQVSQLMQDFIHSVAYVGYTEGVDMAQVTQVIRRLKKSPASMSKEFLLDFLITLAVDNANYAAFDDKSRRFVEDCLDYVEDQFAGQIKLRLKHGDQVLDLFRLKPIESRPSVYNKTLARQGMRLE
jgi:hypothetical protein